MTEHVPLALRWHRLRTCYRIANLATHHVLGFTVKFALLAYVVFAVLFLFLRYAILPNIDYYKGHIEQAASRAAGGDVRIARVYASWHGLRPNLFLGDVTLKDRSGAQVLALPSVSATLSWWSVLALGVRFESLEISRPQLDVRRGADGRLWVAGNLVDTQGSGDGKGADWLLAQREIVIREGQLHWTDQLRGAPELKLEKVNLVLRNTWRRHQFALQATPPAALAAPLDVRANFTHAPFAPRIADVSMWKGELYADLHDADLAAWKTWLDFPFELDSGKGALRAWLSLDHARLAGFTADVGLADVVVRLGTELPQLDLVTVRGRVAAKEELASGPADGKPTFGAHGHSASLSDFTVVTRDGLTLPPTTLSERYVAPRGNAPASTTIAAQLLDLRTLADIAARLPLQPQQRQLLDDFAPRGQLRDFSAQWRGAITAPAGFRVKGRLEGLAMAPQPARAAVAKTASTPARAAVAALPGFDNLSGSIDASDNGGSVRLDSRALLLQMPAWFATPDMLFDKLDLQARWTLEQRGTPQAQLRVDIDSMAFLQQGLSGTLKGSHVLPLAPGSKGAGVADLVGTLDNFDVKTIGRYLPLQTPEHLHHWLANALEGGMAHDVSVRLRGELTQFPFKAATAQERARGEFRVAGRIEGGKLNYTPGEFAKDGKAPYWPQAENIHGSLLFERARMEIRGDTATTGGVALTGVKAVIADLGSHDPILDIVGNSSGAMQEHLNYVAASPVLAWISDFTDQTKATGNTKLALHLNLPLNRLRESTVQGTLQLQGNDVVLFDGMPAVQGASGKIEFNETGVNLNNLAGSFVGGPVAITGGSQPDHSIQVRLGGMVTAEGLKQAYPLPMVQRLARHLSGGARYSGLVTARDQQVQVVVDSTLAGAGLDFPAPLRKSAAESLPLRFVLSGGPVNEAGIQYDDIKVSMGNNLSSHYVRQKQGKQAWRVLRGGIGVNVPAPEPDSGMMLNVNLKTLDMDAWMAVGSAIAGPAAAGAGAGTGAAAASVTATAAATTARGDIDIADYVVPDRLAARASELTLGERKLQNVVVGATHQGGGWQANFDSAQAAGYVAWDDTPSGLGKVTARLSSLIIPESDAAQVQDLLENKSAAQSMPSLDIVAERVELFNKALGRVELQAVNVLSASGHEWRINKVSLENADGALKGTGKWLLKDGKSDTSLNFVLDIHDAGKLLDRFGFVDTVRHGKGTLSGDLAWKGLPYSLDLPSLSGKIAMNVESGQFLKQDPGAAKLLGVLSLQALPRLLKLDFHDVFSEGLAFDGISATADITRGVVQTHNLKMHGLAATVLMDGSADLANESTNLHVVVIPEFNLGTGPVVYALAVNPVIGIGSYLAQLFLRAPVMKALTYHMQVTGPWKAPVMTKLDSSKLEAMVGPSAPDVPAAAPVVK